MSYRTATPLARGGTAEVFRAFDEELGRFVALKYLHRDDPALVERFQREARAQAAVDHPNVCKIYAVGEQDGVPFISMQLIEGSTLDNAARSMTLDEKVRVMRDVASGVHAAHRVGLIHRDLKPGNIMVERNDDGRPVPYVLDFGLVQDESNRGMTLTGEVMGTPSYMAPEQARGDISTLDRRTDVWSLGATLHHVLTGQPPFGDGPPTETLLRILQEDAPPARTLNPSVPRDLESITLKSLERDPSRRYESARAFGEDLQRYLDGEPIEARSATWSYLMAKKMRRHRKLLAVGATGLLLAAALGVWGLVGRWRSARQAELAQRFGQEIRDMEWQLRVAQMVPLHDLTAELDRVEIRLAGIKSAMDELGTAALAPGHYALGRGKLSLDRAEEALEHLARAWDGGLRTPEVAFARGVALGRVYRRSADRARAMRDAQARETALEEARRTYRDPALEALAAARATVSAPLPYVEALVAQNEERWEDAFAHIENVLEETPWFWEAHKLAGDIHLDLAEVSHHNNDNTEAVRRVELAEKSFQEALTLAPSAPEIWNGSCYLGVYRLFLTMFAQVSDEEFETLKQRPLENCAKLEEVHPGHPELPVNQANTHIMTGWRIIARSGDSKREFEQALRYAREAVGRSPDSPTALRALGDSQLALGRIAVERGEDAIERLDQAAGAFSRAAEIEPSPAASNQAGNAYLFKGRQERDRGLDPTESLLQAEAQYRRTAELTPGEVSVHGNIALVSSDLAKWEEAHGIDARPRLRAALEIIDQQIAVAPEYTFLYLVSSGLSRTLAESEWRREGDPDPWLERARQDAVRAAELSPDRYAPWRNRGLAEVLAARLAALRGSDPALAVDEGLAATKRYVELQPDDEQAYRIRSELRRELATHELARGGSADEAVRAGLADIRRALELEPGSASEILPVMLDLLCLEARRTAPAGTSDEAFAEAERVAQRLLELSPNQAISLAAVGRLHLWRAQLASDESIRAEAESTSRDFFERALTINGSLRKDLAEELTMLEGTQSPARGSA